VIGGLIVVAAQLAICLGNDALPLQIAPALDLVLHQEPGKELDPRRRAVFPREPREGAGSQRGGGHEHPVEPVMCTAVNVNGHVRISLWLQVSVKRLSCM
jgi:hypothetical protein